MIYTLGDLVAAALVGFSCALILVAAIHSLER